MKNYDKWLKFSTVCENEYKRQMNAETWQRIIIHSMIIADIKYCIDSEYKRLFGN